MRDDADNDNIKIGLRIFDGTSDRLLTKQNKTTKHKAARAVH